MMHVRENVYKVEGESVVSETDEGEVKWQL